MSLLLLFLTSTIVRSQEQHISSTTRSTSTFRCPMDSKVTDVSGIYGPFINGLNMTCDDGIRTTLSTIYSGSATGKQIISAHVMGDTQRWLPNILVR